MIKEEVFPRPVKKPENELRITFPAKSSNEIMARQAVASFVALLDPTVEELADIKCALSEAVTNSIVHGYRDSPGKGEVYINVRYFADRTVKITVRDRGCGIEDVEKARTPLFTTDASGERSGMGFAVMESFSDRLTVSSRVGHGTTVKLEKKLRRNGR